MADKPREVLFLSPTGIEVRKIDDTYTPTGEQSLVRVSYSGVNPADIKHNTLGLHSSVAGYDMSGEVIAVGPSSRFSVGDKICGANLPGHARELWKGAHQDYAIAQGRCFYKVPAGLGMIEAAGLPAVVQTAADALFNLFGLAFADAGITGTEKQSVLIWGAASGVGLAGVQLAKAAGHAPIFVTASAKHHAKLRELGADACFDYHDEDVVDQIKKEFGKRGVTPRYAFDTVGAGIFGPDHAAGKSSPAIVERCFKDEGGSIHPGTQFACTLPIPEQEMWQMVLATRDKDFNPFGGVVSEEWQVRIVESTLWALKNYGHGKFVIPKLSVAKGIDEAIAGIERSAGGQLSMEKIVVEHPISRI
ncbi:hypothetical protein NX059_004524 [Plenodomus lindquistii]|nr:hypothetical protein NX059_004524 [Plenodomus lindquistii]